MSQFCNCSNITMSQMRSINLIWIVSGFLTLAVSTVITILLLVRKIYKTVLQRLVLYLNICTTLSVLFIVASLEHQFKYPGQVKVCSAIGFLYNWLIILRAVVSVGIKIHMLHLVYKVAKGNTSLMFLKLKHRKVILELAFIILSPVLTLLFSSEPLFTQNYGLAGMWCWISSLNENCHPVPSGFFNQIFLGYFIFILNGFTGIVVTVSFAVIYKRLDSTIRRELKPLMKKSIFVMGFFLVYIIIQLIGLLNRILTTHISQHQHFNLWLVIALIYPFSYILFPVSFLFSFYPITKLGCLSVKSVKCLNFLLETLKKPVRVTSQMLVKRSKYTRATVPSNTFYIVPYTNQFTEINTADQVPLVAREASARDTTVLPSYTHFNVPHTNGFTDITSEVEPLVSKTSTTENTEFIGYGSVPS